MLTEGKRLLVVPGEVRSVTTPLLEPSLNVVGGKLEDLLSDPVESTSVVAAFDDDRNDERRRRASAPFDLDVVMVETCLFVVCCMGDEMCISSQFIMVLISKISVRQVELDLVST